jgi:rhodanese-related sulfurtransferase
VVLDVRTPEEFAVAHHAGALNACVFEVSFLDDARRLIPDPATPVVVYGADTQSLESTEASQRLAWAGYTEVGNYVGGLAEWKRDGLPTLGDGPPPALPVLNGVIPLDQAETRLEWTGRNLLNKHVGTVGMKSGWLSFTEGWLAGGEIVIDMTTLACTDIADATVNQLLIRHLASMDFFDVERYPEARLVVRRTEPVPGGRPGVPNLQLVCGLTVRGITREVSMLATGGRTPEGRVGIQAWFSFDRTDFGSAYGSGRYFRSLGKHLVNDLVEIQARLLA